MWEFWYLRPLYTRVCLGIWLCALPVMLITGLVGFWAPVAGVTGGVSLFWLVWTAMSYWFPPLRW